MSEGYNIIGDIAGQFETLLALLDKMPKNATPISLGDMIDRGPNSKAVLEFFMNNGKAILGNHEHMLLSTCKKDKYYEFGVWYNNGGLETIRSFDPYSEILLPSDIKLECIPSEIIEWIDGLPLFLEIDQRGAFGLKCFISHAIKNPTLKLEAVCDLGDNAYSTQCDSSLLWNRGNPRRMKDFYQISGHNSSWGLKRHSDTKGEYGISIDTSKHKILTGIHWPSGDIYQQEYI
jgi:serine/threonine protein phosphatase 1